MLIINPETSQSRSNICEWVSYNICGEWVTPVCPVLLLFDQSSFSPFWLLGGYGMQGRRGGEGWHWEKLMSPGCTHSLDCNVSVHEANRTYRSRQQRPQTPGAGGGRVSSGSASYPVNGVHQARSDYGVGGREAEHGNDRSRNLLFPLCSTFR